MKYLPPTFPPSVLALLGLLFAAVACVPSPAARLERLATTPPLDHAPLQLSPLVEYRRTFSVFFTPHQHPFSILYFVYTRGKAHRLEFEGIPCTSLFLEYLRSQLSAREGTPAPILETMQGPFTTTVRLIVPTSDLIEVLSDLGRRVFDRYRTDTFGEGAAPHALSEPRPPTLARALQRWYVNELDPRTVFLVLRGPEGADAALPSFECRTEPQVERHLSATAEEAAPLTHPWTYEGTPLVQFVAPALPAPECPTHLVLAAHLRSIAPRCAPGARLLQVLDLEHPGFLTLLAPTSPPEPSGTTCLELLHTIDIQSFERLRATAAASWFLGFEEEDLLLLQARSLLTGEPSGLLESIAAAIEKVSYAEYLRALP
ncbi:MAG: hypothetical protein A2284_06265 [Deltaproteobacteria bacterium RIFOXYA12_FULL_61_11]|nr:MAG: hypothetical protein A2284_06265 [Deltaproteobacteria bacterium RIFOXYA12_FULL_61_11]